MYLSWLNTSEQREITNSGIRHMNLGELIAVDNPITRDGLMRITNLKRCSLKSGDDD